jgi:hypothetical protein
VISVNPRFLLVVLIFGSFGADIRGQNPNPARDDLRLVPGVRASKQTFIVVDGHIPLYPELAKVARVGGIVNVRVYVKKGSVIEAEAKSSAPRVLVNAAVDNIKTWSFTPNSNGTLDVRYVYELEKEEATAPENPRVEMQLPLLVKITARAAKAIPIGDK